MWLSPKIWPPPPPTPPPKKPDPAVQAPKPSPEPAKPEQVKPPAEPVKYVEKPPIALSSKHLDLVLTNKGAGIESATLQYPKDREKVKALEALKNQVPILQSFDKHIPHLAVRHVGGPDA